MYSLKIESFNFLNIFWKQWQSELTIVPGGNVFEHSDELYVVADLYSEALFWMRNTLPSHTHCRSFHRNGRARVQRFRQGRWLHTRPIEISHRGSCLWFRETNSARFGLGGYKTSWRSWRLIFCAFRGGKWIYQLGLKHRNKKDGF